MQGHELTYQLASSPDLRLQNWGEWQYDALIILAPTATSFGGALDAAYLLQYYDAGHDLVIALSSDASEAMLGIVSELGLTPAEPGTQVVDHLSKVEADDTHTHVLSASYAPRACDTAGCSLGRTAVWGGAPPANPVVFQGMGMDARKDHRLAFSVLTAESSGYSQAGLVDSMAAVGGLLAGANLSLISVAQARNNARAAVFGSLHMLSDVMWQQPRASNREVCMAVTRWALQDRGVLEVESFQHRAAGSSERKAAYTINEEIEVELRARVWDGASWSPFLADDLQLEFTMIDPYERLTLTPDAQTGSMRAKFQAPDVYGVFTMSIAHSHPGYSHVVVSERVVVRPPRHDQYERFLPAAYPYYASVGSMMAGFFVLGFYVLHHK